MATISSMLKIQDAFSRPIDKSISAMNKMVDAMENMNRSTKMPNADKTFGEIRTEINLATHALDQFNNELGETGSRTNTVSGVSSGFGGLSKAIIVANQGLQLMQAAWQGVEKVGASADQRIGVDARLSLINDGLQTQAQLESKVMAAANATRSEYTATAALVASMGRQDYFKGSNDKAIQFASTVNKGMVVSGASATEAAGAIIQLTQGLASGVLRGDEFNSIMENAPILAEMMTKSMNVTKGKLRAMAEDGKLTTDVVVSSIMAQSSTLDKQFAQMPMTFGQATTIMGNDVSQMMDYLSQPGHAVDIVIKKIEEMTAYLNTPQGTVLMQNISAGMTTAANILSWFFGIAVSTYQFFADNWSWIGPIVLGVATAIGILTAVTLIYNGVMAVANFIEALSIASKAIHAGSSLTQAAALETATGAQVGLNTAMLANPVTWIIAAVILLIVVIYAVVGAINQATGSSISATGVICGAFAAAGAFIGNIFIVAYNLVLDLFVAQYNFIATFAEFFANVFNDPVGSIIRLFSGLADTILGILKGIASAIDTLFGSHLADAVSGWQKDLQGWTDNVAGEAKIKVPRMDATSLHMDRLNYTDSYNSGYKVGQGIDSKVGGLMNSVTGLSDKLANLNKSASGAGKTSNFGNAYNNPTGGKLDKVKKIGDAVDISDQSLQYLNDIAAAQALDSFDSYQTVTYEQMNGLQLSQKDADALRNSANSSTNVYYLNYSGGGVHIKNNVKKGEDWEEIKAKIHDETESQIETGLSGIDEVVNG
nr:tape measure protein [uncultured Caproiciproducens sp.]